MTMQFLFIYDINNSTSITAGEDHRYYSLNFMQYCTTMYVYVV